MVEAVEVDASAPGMNLVACLSLFFTPTTILSFHSIYHKTQQVYTEKEIFSVIGKAGMAQNSIPDIHQALIDDGLIEKEKIGGSNYFWSFSAKKDRLAQIKHETTLKNIDALKIKVQEASAKLADAKRGREEEETTASTENEDNSTAAPSRAKKLMRLSDLSKRKQTNIAELESLKENDPAALADLEKEFQLVTAAAHRWTDNIFECKSYLVKKRSMDKKEAMKLLGITGNFDCTYCTVILYDSVGWLVGCWGMFDCLDMNMQSHLLDSLYFHSLQIPKTSNRRSFCSTRSTHWNLSVRLVEGVCGYCTRIPSSELLDGSFGC